jgi:hypothetical protein
MTKPHPMFKSFGARIEKGEVKILYSFGVDQWPMYNA